MPINKQLFYQTDKSRQQRCFIKKAVRKNFAIFTRITCVGDPFGTRLLKETPIQMLSCDYCKISNNTCFKEHLGMTASENSKKKRSLGKATSHNDHYMMINMSIQRPKIGGS